MGALNRVKLVKPSFRGPGDFGHSYQLDEFEQLDRIYSTRIRTWLGKLGHCLVVNHSSFPVLLFKQTKKELIERATIVAGL